MGVNLTEGLPIKFNQVINQLKYNQSTQATQLTRKSTKCEVLVNKKILFEQ